MSLRILIYFVAFALFVQSKGEAIQVGGETQEKTTSELRTRIEASPVLPFKGVHLAAQPPSIGWQSGAVSGVAVDSKGTIYEIQRGDKADPVVVLDREGSASKYGRAHGDQPYESKMAIWRYSGFGDCDSSVGADLSYDRYSSSSAPL